ncbi:hypothetical protein [Janthinobacterium sp. 1_2014MBL_MicDiv]|uniref:hypothetical protein n=1 Tax=Janthinobacterium sp. 1_2014MBL_MicDiv TaxID=1644131 RepID=UPI0008F4E502|nr:hypothetical protein [Janthinobacterium sp. 1_2014MBL_MicDiv]APA68211.1 hypothetical protein YQ44_10675 [Janthinobacterium sp. 1_2014MBL_MicDiv]
MLILVTALPLHAAAASIGMACAPAQQHAPPVTSSEVAVHPCHQRAAPLTADDAPAGDDATARHSACDACSAFCMGALMAPPARLAVPDGATSESVSIAAATLAAGYIPDGPRRPPRQTRAA